MVAEADDPDDEMTSESVATGTKSHPGWRKVLAGCVFQACGVYVLMGRGQLILAGKRGDVDTAKYLYAAIANEIERLAKVNAHGRGRRFANAYRVACAESVGRRLLEQSKETVRAARAAGASEAALVKVESAVAEAQDWYAQDHERRTGEPPKVRSCRVTTSSEAGRAAGLRDGSTINIGGNAALRRGRLALGLGS